MGLLKSVLPYAQVLLAVLLVTAIILQRRGSSLGGAFGGDNFSAAFHTRRGLELYLFWGSVVLGTLFALSAFAALILR